MFFLKKIIISGKRKLQGEVSIHGAKNAVLPILCASILCEDKVVLHNCPKLSDVNNTLSVLESLGCQTQSFENTIEIIPSKYIDTTINEEYMSKMRSSILFLSGCIAREGKANLSLPGGCELGPRPIDIHIKCFEKMGVDVIEKRGVLNCSCNRLQGAHLNLPFPSVGATENVMILASKAEGITIIRNAAREPEIKDLAEFLNKCGAQIKGAGTDKITIKGVKKLNGCEHTIISDRIEASTYMAFCAVTGGDLLIKDVQTEFIQPVVYAFRESGCKTEFYKNSLRITAPKRLARVNRVKTLVYPGFPTDSVMNLMAMCAVAKGTSVFEETIFQNRFNSAQELNKMGAQIKVYDRIAVVEGVEELFGAEVKATDLRGGAALVCAGLCANSTTTISQTSHIYRGYENLVENLKKLGADIKTENA